MNLIKHIVLFFCLINTVYGSPTVIATHSIIADWVQNIAGETVNLVTLVPADTDNHSFEPTPQDAVTLSEAKIIFENGLGMEYWLDKLYNASKSTGSRVALSSQIDPIYTQHHCCHHHHGDYDPHFWLSIPNAIKALPSIYEALVALQPQYKKLYIKNTRSYTESLKHTQKSILKTLGTIPENKRLLITNHDSFRYFAKEYNFQIIGSALGSATTDSLDPSASHFAKLKSLINQYKLTAIFAENIQNNAILNELARETKLPTPSILYTGALSGENGPASTYINLMSYNAMTIQKSLK